MYELYPYYTNDGSIGLFSKEAEDIYHSTSGAVSESWQKFILPADLENFINNNSEIKILDICYGIGYNTKSALKVFVDNYKKNRKNIKKSLREINNIVQIDTDNISSDKNSPSLGNSQNFTQQKNKKSNANTFYNDTIGTDNTEAIYYKKILIDAVDNDEILMQLSPFIRDKKNKSFFNRSDIPVEKLTEHELDKFYKIKRLRDEAKTELNKKYKIDETTEIILLMNLLKKCDFNFSDSNDFNKILFDKNYSSFFNEKMVSFTNFYKNQGYKYKDKINKSTFLHNIYYKYLSYSYKLAKEIALSNKVEVNFHNNDARAFVSTANETYNFIFLDAFTPAKCPALWSIQFFEQLHRLLDNDGMLLTYSNSAAIRNAMIHCGFFIGKIFNPNTKKFSGTIAYKNKNLVKYKLSEQELGLLNTKAGICYEDETLNCDNTSILRTRTEVVKHSNLASSSKYFRSFIK